MLYYKILGFIDHTPPKEAITSSYRKLARTYHPDKNKSPEAERMFKKINAAYTFLTDDNNRAEYDRSIERGLIHVADDDSAFVARPVFVRSRSFSQEKPSQKSHHPKSKQTYSGAPKQEREQSINIFDCLTVEATVNISALQIRFGHFVERNEHLGKNKDGDTALHVLAKNLHNNDKKLAKPCVTFIMSFITAAEAGKKWDSALLNQKNNEGHTVLDLVQKAKELSYADKAVISTLIVYLERKGAIATPTQNEAPSTAKPTQNGAPTIEAAFITNAQKELDRITKNGCSFFMCKDRHTAKINALKEAIQSKVQEDISSALKMHRSIAPFNIFKPESARALKR